MPKRARSRRDVTADLLAAGRVFSAAAVMFHSVVAAKQGLSATEEKTLDLLQRFGPLTAGELASQSGLAPPSVTGLIDRLEKKGFVRRQPDAADGRKVRIHVQLERFASFAPLFKDFVAELESLCTEFSVEQLEVITRFMLEASSRQQACAAKLSSESP